MPVGSRVPEATIYRLSLYHCYLGELLRTGGANERITSRQMAAQLNVKEETVRRDISFVGEIGRPGAGYAPRELFDAFTAFLGLSDHYPIVKVGTAKMLEALEVVFPPLAYGVDPVAYYSELPGDAGRMIGDVEVRQLTEIATLNDGREIPVTVALVACAPGWVQVTLDLLASAGVEGVLLLTPAIKLNTPEGMNIRQIRMPCDIKSLACECRIPVA